MESEVSAVEDTLGEVYVGRECDAGVGLSICADTVIAAAEATDGATSY